MRKTENFLLSIKEAVAYGFLSSSFVLIVLLIEESFTKFSCKTGLSCGYAERSIPIGCVFIGATLFVLIWNLLFDRIIKSSFIKWLFILITSSFTAILFQIIFLISSSSMTTAQIISEYFPEGIDEFFEFELMVKLFLILTPFTILFANHRLIIEKIKNRNSLN